MTTLKQATMHGTVYGALLAGDVFTCDGTAYQKMADGTAYEPLSGSYTTFDSWVKVSFYGYGIWPSNNKGGDA